MHYLLLFILIFFSHLVNGQTTDNLVQDTSLANSYMVQAQQLDVREEKRKQLLRQAFEIYQTYPHLPQAIWAKSLYSEATYWDRPEIAIQLAKETIEQAKTAKEESIPAFAIPAYICLMEYEEGFNLDFEKVIELGKSIEPIVPTSSFWFFRLKGILIRNYGNLEQTDKRKAEILEMKSAFEDGQALMVSDSTMVFYHLMKYETLFEKNHEKAVSYGLEFAKLLAPDDFRNQILLSYWLAYVHLELDDFKEADKWLNHLKAQESKATFINLLEKVGFYFILCDVMSDRHHFEESIAYGEKGLDLLGTQKMKYAKRSSDLYLYVGIAYNRIAQFHDDAAYFAGYIPKDNIDVATYYQEAERYYKESLKYTENALTYYFLSGILSVQKKFDEAIVNSQKVMEANMPDFRPNSIEENPSMATLRKFDPLSDYIFFNKGFLLIQKYYHLSDLDENEKIKILEDVLEIVEMIIALREDKLASLDGFESSIFKYNKRTILLYGYARMALFELYDLNPSEALFDRIFYYTEKRKVMSLVETLTPSKLPAEFTKELMLLKQELLDVQQDLDLAAADSLSYYEEELFAAQGKLSSYQKMIKEKHPKTANNFYNLKYATADEIAAELDEETLFLSIDPQNFGSLGATYSVVAIGKDKRKTFQTYQDTVLRHIWNLEKMQKNPLIVQKKNREQFIDFARRLYEIVLEPIEDMLEGKTKIILVQEGDILRVPFDLLLATREKKPFHELDFLIKKYEITYHYSATAYLQLKQRAAVKDYSLLAFAPVFEQAQGSLASTALREFLVDTLHRSVEDNRFIPLPSTKVEVQTINQSLQKIGETEVLMEKKATKKNLMAALEKQPYQFIHIATHGLVNMDKHLLSGLACTHQDGERDALLFANEIQQLDINADLVVLSSCESGVGMVIRGEGLIAINRAFFYAGAKNIIFSLWKVNDKYTSDLMIDFYNNYLKTSDYSQALRQAKLKMLEDPTTANPRFWASFVLIGE